MLDGDGRRFTFLYRCAGKGLLANAGLSLRVAGRKVPRSGREQKLILKLKVRNKMSTDNKNINFFTYAMHN